MSEVTKKVDMTIVDAAIADYRKRAVVSTMANAALAIAGGALGAVLALRAVIVLKLL